METVIKADNLKKKYDNRPVLNVKEVKIKKNKIFSIIGPNGAGKSAFLRTVGLLESFSSGELYILGNKIIPGKDNLFLRRKISTVFQEPLMYNMTVEENIAMGLRFRKISGKIIKEKAEQWMETLNITHLALRNATKLSGGEKSRVSLARAFVTEPEIILLDEPFSDLDPPTGERLIYELKSILSKLKTTALFVTHVRKEALMIADRLAVMFDGTLVQQGTPDSVFNRPANDRVADFVGIETVLSGEVIENRGNLSLIKIPEGKIIKASSEVKAGEAVKVCIRPENVVISCGGEVENFKSTFRNSFQGKIIKLIPAGLYYKVEMDCGFKIIAFISKQAMEEMELTEGKSIRAYFKAASTHVIKS